jgi:hypothetical protein
MYSYRQILILVIIGIVILSFVYFLFSRFAKQFVLANPKKRKKQAEKNVPGAPRTCPLCSARLELGERVKSAAFPSIDGANDRLMHISGCPYCLEGGRIRVCPVCGIPLKLEEIVIARIFEKPGRSHVHVLGCSRCRGPRSQRP